MGVWGWDTAHCPSLRSTNAHENVGLQKDCGLDLQSQAEKWIAGRNAIHFDTRIADLECNPFKKDFDDAWFSMIATFAAQPQYRFLSGFSCLNQVFRSMRHFSIQYPIDFREITSQWHTLVRSRGGAVPTPTLSQTLGSWLALSLTPSFLELYSCPIKWWNDTNEINWSRIILSKWFQVFTVKCPNFDPVLKFKSS